MTGYPLLPLTTENGKTDSLELPSFSSPPTDKFYSRNTLTHTDTDTDTRREAKAKGKRPKAKTETNARTLETFTNFTVFDLLRLLTVLARRK